MRRSSVALLGLLALAACDQASRTPPLFEALPAARTGVAFSNDLPERADFNILNYLYYYDGGGVAAGDVNGDGLPDLYFTANLGRNRLYLNKGSFRFEDVTDRAGVADSVGWKTGVTMADVNGDGKLDIYVSAVDYLNVHGRNVLYVNDGDGTFTDRTTEYGLDHAGYSTQALFFDYDRDGDLDMFLLDHATHAERLVGGGGAAVDARGHHPSDDLLFRNDRTRPGGTRFTDVTAAAGIHELNGFGLGVVASDVNGDGCVDLYVANDFQEDDALWINRCDGTFADSIATAMRHTSRSSMGTDAADFDNDLRPDVVTADMLPWREDIMKSSANADSWTVFNLRLRAGYQPQFARNALQLNRGDGRFSEIGQLARVHATDWSWAPLFADLDDDGWKDLFITNGIYRRPNDLDYVGRVGGQAGQAALAGGDPAKTLELLRSLPRVALPNAAFRNAVNLSFSDVAAAWGLDRPGFSNGAAYVDLDNDGALDLVVSNIDAPASIYRNRARERTANHFLTVELKGAGANTAGIGAKVLVHVGGLTQLVEQQPTRGFQSSVDPRPHFGLGAATRVDSLVVVWPDGRRQTLAGVAADRVVVVEEPGARGQESGTAGTAVPSAWPLAPTFTDISPRAALTFRHRENTPLDFDREPLLPHLLSTEGPALAAGDVNGDGLDDVYLGGAKWQRGALFLQRADGTFRESAQPALAADSLAEDVDAAFFDADGDGHLDLFVVSGGNEFGGRSEALRDRLYLNDGQGNLRRAAGALPDFFDVGSCVVPGDFDGDGDADLFVGSRVVTRSYGLAPRSHLLRNDGQGRFTDVTTEKSDALAEAGMVTSAAWLDYDGDGALDLVVAGEWMPVRVFRQENGRFVDRTREAGLDGTNGWWNTVSAVDLNGDRRLDLVLGNLGLNSFLKASAKEPARLYVADFSHAGSTQPIVTSYRNGVSYPLAGRDELLRQNPLLRSRFPTYASFGASRIEDIFDRRDLARAKVLEAQTFASAVAIADGKGRFALRQLPVQAQLAPVRAVVARDFDGDGTIDLLLAGNFHGVPPVLGRYDASYGLLLQGKGDGSFTAVDMPRSGVMLEGEVRHMALVRARGGGTYVVAARNDDTPVVLRVKP